MSYDRMTIEWSRAVDKWQVAEAAVRLAVRSDGQIDEPRPDSPTARQPDSPTARQPDSPTARQPDSPTARQPGSVEAGLALAGPVLAALERLAKPARGQRSGTVFRHADLRPADLRGTDLSTADLLQTRLTGALAGERFDCGEGAAVIAKDLRVSERSVERRRRAWWEGAMTALASTGPPKLSDGQFAFWSRSSRWDLPRMAGRASGGLLPRIRELIAPWRFRLDSSVAAAAAAAAAADAPS
ncbi:pentapeptide repeat-containing protein [Streptomyces bottropensis]|uniref:pentapeptide repeat-containing protein n=1 Tax=Streptomyces bottropensis TaxID=42235 RepID=UPI00369722C2